MNPLYALFCYRSKTRGFGVGETKAIRLDKPKPKALTREWAHAEQPVTTAIALHAHRVYAAKGPFPSDEFSTSLSHSPKTVFKTHDECLHLK